jgi:predicted transposase/invertase (TIGR01784 family)
MKIIYLELPKFRRHLGDGYARTGLERWLLYFSNEEGERMNKAATENPVLSSVREIESAFWADENEKELYFAHQRMLMDAYSAEHTHEYLIAEAQKEGLEKGRKEGLEKGREEVARSMLAGGVNIETIAKYTGLDEETILSLADK